MRSILGSIGILLSTMSLAFILSHYTSNMGWIDLTKNDRYSLTDGTKNILKNIRRPLKARLFYSQTANGVPLNEWTNDFLNNPKDWKDIVEAPIP